MEGMAPEDTLAGGHQHNGRAMEFGAHGNTQLQPVCQSLSGCQQGCQGACCQMREIRPDLSGPAAQAMAHKGPARAAASWARHAASVSLSARSAAEPGNRHVRCDGK